MWRRGSAQHTMSANLVCTVEDPTSFQAPIDRPPRLFATKIGLLLPWIYLKTFFRDSVLKLKVESRTSPAIGIDTATYTVKKRFASFPSPAGMSLPNSPWAGIMTS